MYSSLATLRDRASESSSLNDVLINAHSFCTTSRSSCSVLQARIFLMRSLSFVPLGMPARGRGRTYGHAQVVSRSVVLDAGQPSTPVLPPTPDSGRTYCFLARATNGKESLKIVLG